MNTVEAATHPVWENVKGGKLKAVIRMSKPKAHLFKGQPPHVHEEIIGRPEDRDAMEAHVVATLDWLNRYDAYYGVTGWIYEVKWK